MDSINGINYSIEVPGLQEMQSALESQGSLSGTLSIPVSEDEAIISAQAKLLNELEKYNAGESDEIKLALTVEESTTQTEAMYNVIGAKNQMLNSIMQIMDSIPE
ncbi:MAG: hypothetical protein PHV68_00495 [Candidatus Gastranaerophilales bacterium]|nr:hypothetical protein [Candidatus Gastranaerophilales bacterium]